MKNTLISLSSQARHYGRTSITCFIRILFDADKIIDKNLVKPTDNSPIMTTAYLPQPGTETDLPPSRVQPASPDQAAFQPNGQTLLHLPHPPS